jgi:chitinase
MTTKKVMFCALIACLLAAVFLTPRHSSAAPPTYTLTTAVVGSGAVDPAGGTYNKNTMVTVTAIPDSGWTFDHWDGDLSGTENPTTIRMSSDKHVIAVFVEEGVPTPTPTPTPTPEPHGKEVAGYFAQWAIYRRNYLVKNVVTSGSAEKLTVINYAFAGIDDDLKCMSLDPFADYNKAFDESESVDGVADPTSGTVLRGNFNQLRKLKIMYPQIRVLISIGGWSDSYNFSDAALPENRAAFVSSCVDMFINGNFAPGIVDPTVFDGIDVDWEYPAMPGMEGNVYRPEDTQNFTALLAEFRSQLDAIDPDLLLTIAAPAGEPYYSKIELGLIHPYLDWINLMTYDYHGGWEMTTNHHAPLYSSPADPTAGGSTNDTVLAYLDAGISAGKLHLGVPFYGRGWAGVPDVNNGLYQTAGRIPRGKYEKGVDDFKELENYGYPGFWDPVAQAYWIYNGNEFWSYDNADSVTNKMGYVVGQNLGGVMFWELSGDDATGTLITAIDNGLR